jgi:hypothetical protein
MGILKKDLAELEINDSKIIDQEKKFFNLDFL